MIVDCLIGCSIDCSGGAGVALVSSTRGPKIELKT